MIVRIRHALSFRSVVLTQIGVGNPWNEVWKRVK
jgi:hypothetical protein